MSTKSTNKNLFINNYLFEVFELDKVGSCYINPIIILMTTTSSCERFCVNNDIWDDNLSVIQSDEE